MTNSYWQDLPPDQQAQLNAIAQKYLSLIPGKEHLREIPDRETAMELLLLQQLDVEILDMHNAWLRKVKAAIERTGREYTRENFLRYCRLREVE